jgi:hypothetical protein
MRLTNHIVFTFVMARVKKVSGDGRAWSKAQSARTKQVAGDGRCAWSKAQSMPPRKKSQRLAAIAALKDERVVKLFKEGGAIGVTCDCTADMKIVVLPLSGKPCSFKIACAVCETALDPYPWTQWDYSKCLYYDTILWRRDKDALLLPWAHTQDWDKLWRQHFGTTPAYPETRVLSDPLWPGLSARKSSLRSSAA